MPTPHHILIAFAAALLAACSPSPPDAEPALQEPALPDGVEVAVFAAMPGVSISDFEQQDVDDGGELEITATTAEGVEYEFDLVPGEPGGAWSVAQIQRDIAWADAPQIVRDAFAASPVAFEPVRVIESREPVDGAVYYQLFSAADQPQHPSQQVRLLDGEAAVMPPAH